MEQKMTPAGPPQPPAAQTEEWTAPTSRGGGWIVLAVLIVAGVAVAAYFIGRSAAHAPGAYDRGYAQGRKAMALEFAHGTALGRLRGQRTGIASGAGAALGGFTSWQPGNYYVVKLARGVQGVPYRIDVRKL